jgi:RNA polymerase subunit RPABC4/transcription elongation factor Spt4
MTCARCRKKFAEEAARCPHCGEATREGSGVIQTSIVLISAGASDLIYRTVEEVPAGLRNKLLRSTNGANSATILIADRRGRKEVAKAMRTLPGPARRRLIRSALGSGAASAARWLTPTRKRAVLAVLTLLVLTIIALVFSVRPLSGGH